MKKLDRELKRMQVQLRRAENQVLAAQNRFCLIKQEKGGEKNVSRK